MVRGTAGGGVQLRQLRGDLLQRGGQEHRGAGMRASGHAAALSPHLTLAGQLPVATREPSALVQPLLLLLTP